MPSERGFLDLRRSLRAVRRFSIRGLRTVSVGGLPGHLVIGGIVAVVGFVLAIMCGNAGFHTARVVVLVGTAGLLLLLRWVAGPPVSSAGSAPRIKAMRVAIFVLIFGASLWVVHAAAMFSLVFFENH